jgi:transposase, IS5 family
LRGPTTRVVDRSRRIGKLVRAISKTLARRTGQRVDEVLALNATAGRALGSSIGEARRLAAQARGAARGRGAQAKLRAARRLEDLAARCQRVAAQIQQRVRGEQLSDRLVSLSDPDARPIRKGKLGKPGEFGYVAQLAQGHRHHPTRRPRGGAARGQRAGQPGRAPPAGADHRRAGPAGLSTA